MNQSNTIETLKLFVQTVIDETKNDNIVWSVDTEYIANTDPFVSPIAFSAKYKDTEMYLQRNEKEYRFVGHCRRTGDNSWLKYFGSLSLIL